ncbi:hypothetical protein REH81_02200 [Vibrio rotiferianus]
MKTFQNIPESVMVELTPKLVVASVMFTVTPMCDTFEIEVKDDAAHVVQGLLRSVTREDAQADSGNGFNYQETSTILAGLRILQDKVDDGSLADYRKLPHFDDVEPLSSDQIDELCEKLNQ